MEFSRAEILWGIVLPFVVSALSVAVTLPSRLRECSWLFGLLGVWAAFTIAFFTGQARQPWPPADSVQYLWWLTPVAVASLIIAHILGHIACRKSGQWYMYAVWFAVIFAAAVAIAWPLAGNLRGAKAVAEDGFTEVPRYAASAIRSAVAAMSATMAIAGLALAGCVHRVNCHADEQEATDNQPRGSMLARVTARLTAGRITSLQIWALAVGLAIVLAIGGANPKVGPIRAGALAIAVALWFFSRGGRGLPATGAALIGLLGGGLLTAGIYYYTVQPWHAWLLLAAIVWMLVSARWNRWLRLAVTLAMIGGPMAYSLVLFQRQMLAE